jgi:hypothetical protein
MSPFAAHAIAAWKAVITPTVQRLAEISIAWLRVE